MNRPPAREFTVPAALAGERLDRAIAVLAPDVSRGEARRLIAAGVVFVGDKRTGIQSRLVRAGELVRWESPIAASARVPDDIDDGGGPQPRIVVERAELWVVDKPAGMPVEATRAGKHGTLAAWLTDRHGAAYVTHRLDTPTSGLIVVARDAQAQARLNRLFAAHAVIRRYLAVVVPAPSWDRVTLDAPLDGRAAVTHATVRARSPLAALLEVRLETGRSRQIRRHLSGVGLPVVGENAAGARTAHRLLLHAFALRFAWDGAGSEREIEATAPPPEDFATPAESFGLTPADLTAAVDQSAE